MLILLTLALATAPGDTLTLVKAVELGRTRAISAVVARIGTRVADIRVGERRADLLPNVSGAASLTRQTLNLDEFGIPLAKGITDPFSLFNLRLRVQQTIYDPAAFGRLAATRDSVAAAGLDAQAAGTIAGATAGIAFLRALSAEETVVAREADSAVASRLLDQARQLNQAGITAAIDVTRSEVNVATVRAQLAVARNLRERTRLDLYRALDFPADTTMSLSHEIGTGTTDVPTGRDATSFALTHRRDLEAERQRLVVMEKGRQAIRAENLPSVAASGALTESGRKTSTLENTWMPSSASRFRSSTAGAASSDPASRVSGSKPRTSGSGTSSIKSTSRSARPRSTWPPPPSNSPWRRIGSGWPNGSWPRRRIDSRRASRAASKPPPPSPGWWRGGTR